MSPIWGVSTCVWPSRMPDRSFHAAPVWTPHLQKRLLSEKPVAPTICPITCTSAMALSLSPRALTSETGSRPSQDLSRSERSEAP